MCERMIFLFQFERCCHAAVRNLPQRKNRLQVRHLGDFGDEELAASSDLDGQRLVLRRHAAHGIGNAHTYELESVIALRAIGPVGKTVSAERAVQQVPRVIARERTACAVRALQSWSEAHDQKSSVEPPKAWDWIIEEVRVAAAVRAPELRQPRAERTICEWL